MHIKYTLLSIRDNMQRDTSKMMGTVRTLFQKGDHPGIHHRPAGVLYCFVLIPDNKTTSGGFFVIVRHSYTVNDARGQRDDARPLLLKRLASARVFNVRSPKTKRQEQTAL